MGRASQTPIIIVFWGEDSIVVNLSNVAHNDWYIPVIARKKKGRSKGEDTSSCKGEGKGKRKWAAFFIIFIK